MKKFILVIVFMAVCFATILHAETFDSETVSKADSIYKIIQHEHIPTKKKIEIIDNSGIGTYTSDVNNQMHVFNSLLESSKKENDNNAIVYTYCKIAYLNIYINDKESIRQAGIMLTLPNYLQVMSMIKRS